MKRLYKSNNKVVCGVCAGLAEYLDMDPTVVRLVFAALVLFAGLSIWVYVIAAIIIPRKEDVIVPGSEDYYSDYNE